MTDWQHWHREYDQPGSWQAARLKIVQGAIKTALDNAPVGKLSIIDICAGEGRDLLPVLAEHPRRDDVTVRMVELDPRICDDLFRATQSMPNVKVTCGDAALTSYYVDDAPADIVLLGGVFPHISRQDRRLLIRYCMRLVKQGGVVIWTIHRSRLARELDRVFTGVGFDRVWMTAPEIEHAVAVSKNVNPPEPLRPGFFMFKFVGLEKLPPMDR